MKYEKPQIILSGNALFVIHGAKPEGEYSDTNPTKHQTIAAYEADE